MGLLVLLFGAAAPTGDAAVFGGLTLRLDAHAEECFYDEANRANEKGFMHFQVTSGGALDIDAAVYGPDDKEIWSAHRETEALVLFKTTRPGTYRFCFSNGMSTLTYKTVAFDVAIGDPAESTKDHSVDPIEGGIIRISEGLNEIKQEQTYMRTRERVHRDTAEDTNARVLWFSVLEIGMLLAMGLGQV